MSSEKNDRSFSEMEEYPEQPKKIYENVVEIELPDFVNYLQTIFLISKCLKKYWKNAVFQKIRELKWWPPI